MNTYNELLSFGTFVLIGAISANIFDVFRALRKAFKTSDFITYIEDTLFFIIIGGVLFYSIFILNDGIIRGYIFIGLIIGIIMYIIFLSKYFIKIVVKILYTLKTITKYLIKILILPLKLLKKVIIRPISFIFINIKKEMKKIHIKLSNIFKLRSKKKNLKKDFE